MALQMKAAQREPYLILTKVALPDFGMPILCSFCKYSEWSGCCEEGKEVTCSHPLWQVSEDLVECAQEGCDCWGFRASTKREDAVDIVGIWLRGEYYDGAHAEVEP